MYRVVNIKKIPILILLTLPLLKRGGVVNKIIWAILILKLYGLLYHDDVTM